MEREQKAALAKMEADIAAAKAAKLEKEQQEIAERKRIEREKEEVRNTEVMNANSVFFF
jgi:hypothetical protein